MCDSLSGPAPAAGPSAGATVDLTEIYIVMLTSYAPREEHERKLDAALKRTADAAAASACASAAAACNTAASPALPPPPPPLLWQWIQRNNPASAYPTDFLLLHTTHKQLLRTLRAHPHVKSVSQQRRAHRTLANWNEPHTGDDNSKRGQKNSAQAAASAAAAATETANESTSFAAAAAVRSAAIAQDEYSPTAASSLHGTPAPQRFSGRQAFRALLDDDGDSDDADEWMSPRYNRTPTSSPTARQLRSFGVPMAVSRQQRADALWRAGHKGGGIRIAIFDTGLSVTHPHFRTVAERTNWTDEPQLDDVLGHGTFVAGVVAGGSSECSGFAPDAALHIYRVFNSKQLSFTAWFLDAFNHAIHADVHVLNLSIGGPDFADQPFTDKVAEMSAHGIIVVSAIGNDGPLYGTLNNPADQLDVLGVGGMDAGERELAAFSSRGMTTWELPRGYGRVKPDIIALAKNIAGSKIAGGCRTLSGTSVASPVVAGAVVLLASVVPEAERARLVNPASMKQALAETAERLPAPVNVFEQGSGKLQLLPAYEWLQRFEPHASVLPATLDLTDCPYMWPYCTQPAFATAQPLIVNLTLLNSQSVTSWLAPGQPPRFAADPPTDDVLDVQFEAPRSFWPWSGWIAMHVRVRERSAAGDGGAEGRVASGTVHIVVASSSGELSHIAVPLRVRVQAPPPRKMRLLFDAFHSLRYPSGYFPRDNLDTRTDTLDWNGDHLHTNYRDLYTQLRGAGYFIDVLGSDLTCFDARLYSTLLLVDGEDEYAPSEQQKLLRDVQQRGLSVLMLAEWFNHRVMRDVKFYDENTASWWTPETGGANVPAINDLLAPLGIALSDHVVRGIITINQERQFYASGTTIARFPAGGSVLRAALQDAGSGARADKYAVLGLLQADVKAAVDGIAASADADLDDGFENSSDGALPVSAGRVAVYGDSNCVDMNHSVGTCYRLVLSLLEYTSRGRPAAELFPDAELLAAAFSDSTQMELPTRMLGSNLAKYSRVVGPHAEPTCAQRRHRHADDAALPSASPDAPDSLQLPSRADGAARGRSRGMGRLWPRGGAGTNDVNTNDAVGTVDLVAERVGEDDAAAASADEENLALPFSPPSVDLPPEAASSAALSIFLMLAAIAMAVTVAWLWWLSPNDRKRGKNSPRWSPLRTRVPLEEESFAI